MQTASLKSTTLKTSSAVANTLSASEISLNGADVVQSIQEKGRKALSNLISRELVNDEDYYIIWDDSGQPLDVKLPEGYCPSFSGCSGLKEWKWDLSSVANTQYKFLNCKKLEIFESDLIDANWIFYGCIKLHTVKGDWSKLVSRSGLFLQL